MKTKLLCCLLAATVLFAGCKKFKGEYTIPAYLHLDKMHVVDNSVSLSSEAGFFSSQIDGVQLELWFDGADTTTRLGTFQLPCTVPVLCDKPIKKINVYPFVKQNGLAGTRIYYPYYQYAELHDLPLTADSVTNLGAQGADGLWDIPIRYQENMAVLASEFFEPASAGTIFDTNVTARHHDGLACSGAGYGVVRVSADTNTLDFEIKTDFNVTDPTKILYLEMDVKNDVRLSVQMRSAYMVGANEQTQDIMTLYEHDQWKKIYINLGGTWADFSHNPDFHIVFSALNPEGIEGEICLDNIKILAI